MVYFPDKDEKREDTYSRKCGFCRYYAEFSEGSGLTCGECGICTLCGLTVFHSGQFCEHWKRAARDYPKRSMFLRI